MRTFRQTNFTFYKPGSPGGSVADGLKQNTTGKTHIQANSIQSGQSKATIESTGTGGDKSTPKKYSGLITGALVVVAALVLIGGVIHITKNSEEENTNLKNDKT